MRETIIEFPYSANTHRDGHSFHLLKADSLRPDNTSGAKGVYKKGGKYIAKVVIGGKQIQLGVFPNADSATAARIIVDSTIENEIEPAYAAWYQRASADPAWAENNPFQIRVARFPNSLPRFSCNFFNPHWSETY